MASTSRAWVAAFVGMLTLALPAGAQDFGSISERELYGGSASVCITYSSTFLRYSAPTGGGGFNPWNSTTISSRSKTGTASTTLVLRSTSSSEGSSLVTPTVSTGSSLIPPPSSSQVVSTSSLSGGALPASSTAGDASSISSTSIASGASSVSSSSIDQPISRTRTASSSSVSSIDVTSIDVTSSTVTSSTVTSSTVTSSTATSTPICGLVGFDGGRNIAFYSQPEYLAYDACLALCNANSDCLSFGLSLGPLSSPPACILYNATVADNIVASLGSGNTFYDKGCPPNSTTSLPPASSTLPPASSNLTPASSSLSSVVSSAASTTSSTSSTPTTPPNAVITVTQGQSFSNSIASLLRSPRTNPGLSKRADSIQSFSTVPSVDWVTLDPYAEILSGDVPDDYPPSTVVVTITVAASSTGQIYTVTINLVVVSAQPESITDGSSTVLPVITESPSSLTSIPFPSTVSTTDAPSLVTSSVDLVSTEAPSSSSTEEYCEPDFLTTSFDPVATV